MILKNFLNFKFSFRMKNLRKKEGVKLITNSEDYLKLVSKLVSFVL